MGSKYFTYVKSIEELDDVIETKEYGDQIDEGYCFKYNLEEYSILFSEDFPAVLPAIYMKKPRRHPHVSFDGIVCLNRIEDIDFDIENIETVIRKTFNSFFNVMSLDSENFDYTYEFGDYIKYFKSFSKNMRVNVVQHFDFTKPHMTKMLKSDKFLYITDQTIEKKYLNIKQSDLSQINVLFIPLKKYFSVPEIGSSLFTSEIIECIDSCHFSEVSEILKSKKPKCLFIAIKNVNGFYNCFCMQLNQSFSKISENIEIINIYQVSNLTQNYLKARAGVFERKERILLIGLGSLGSEILYHLCKSGFDYVDICDFDIIEPVNIYRHFLGYSNSFAIRDKKYFDLKKTEALKQLMENRYPSVRINAFYDRIETLLKKELINLNEYDYIINATGNMISNRFLNNYMYKNNMKNNVIYSWIEPFGVALHIFTNRTSEYGCLNCLMLSSNKVFLAEEDNYVIQNDNCIGSFTKFGSLDVSRLAIETIKTIMDKKFETRHKIILGDFQMFLNEGFKLTEYSKLSETQLNNLGEDIVYEGCPICGSCNH
jgi:molybdopterin/thiamine biosynthesis adenylyltransferase/ubiquitin-protein ligase